MENLSVHRATVPFTDRAVRYKTIAINDIPIFYREAGKPGNPVILLLHGFPSSSHMYRHLLDQLSDRYHLIAPDYPGFGNSAMPDQASYNYSFDQLSDTIELFIDALSLTRFSLYMQDYGSPVGYRIIVRRPELVEALLIQNANAYEEGLGPAIADGKRYWANRNEETENAMRGILTPAGTQIQYTDGAGDPSKLSPDAWLYDQYFLDRKGNAAIQLDLLYDYRNNITLYPAWQEYLRNYQPPALITWGRKDQLFTAAGAEAYLRDLPQAELHLLDTGHFALEEYHYEIADLIHRFLLKQGISGQ